MEREIAFNDVYDSQMCYRLLLDSMARPGKLNTVPDMNLLPPAGLHQGSAILALTLFNTDVKFHVDHVNAKQIETYITQNTMAAAEEITEANYVFINGNNRGHILGEVRLGTLSYPEDGATCIIDVEKISNTFISGAIRITLNGPGVETQQEIFVTGLHEGILQNISTQNAEFPLGLDVILTDVHNTISCIPRSNRFTWEH